MEPLRKLLHGEWSVTGRLIADFAVYFVIGSTWFFVIGLLVRMGVTRLLNRDCRDGNYRARAS
jgi:hypothetical protein